METSGPVNYPLKTINNAPSTKKSDLSPLDFSFRRLKHVTDIVEEEQNSVTTTDKEDILKSSDDHNKITTTIDLEGRDPEKGNFPKSVKRSKSRSKCLRLNNNSLTTVDGLSDILTSLFLQPLYLSWLDLSFNRLTEISATFCNLPCLQILYLHGNYIQALSQVENLRPTQLKKLTLHGNPIENVKNYRNTVLTTIPTLNEFDFSCVVKSDRDNAEVWRKNHQSLVERRKNAKRKAQQEKVVC